MASWWGWMWACGRQQQFAVERAGYLVAGCARLLVTSFLDEALKSFGDPRGDWWPRGDCAMCFEAISLTLVTSFFDETSGAMISIGEAARLTSYEMCVSFLTTSISGQGSGGF